MLVPSFIISLHNAFENWLFKKAFPYWATIGMDGNDQHPFQWGAHEQLKLDGTPDLPGYKRMRVQARQLYAFSQASLLGWTQGWEIAENIYQFMQNSQQGEGVWARRLTREGKILDPTADLYDLAFIIFSFAWYARLTHDPKPIVQARQIINWIQIYMRYPEGGYRNSFPKENGYRQQNPHMHLLEAALALYETTHAEQDLNFAQQLIQLFQHNFFEHRTGTLGEYFDENWHCVPNITGNMIEPGHQYEWIWLLHEYSKLIEKTHQNEASRMYHFNQQHAIDQTTGLVYDKILRDGTPIQKSSRLWAQTEALRAASLMTDEKSYRHLGQVIQNLLCLYFADCPAGTWRDQFDDQHLFCDTKIPTSSFYHIVSGFLQLNKLVNLSK